MATETQTQIQKLDRELNEMITSGNIMEAFEQFYAENLVMQENNEPPISGKDQNRQREIDFMSNVVEFKKYQLIDSAVEGNRSYSTWDCDFTLKDGTHFIGAQVAYRQWQNDQIVFERFFYAGK